jgi:tetratricopeptide (TPR) repeat protein
MLKPTPLQTLAKAKEFIRHSRTQEAFDLLRTYWNDDKELILLTGTYAKAQSENRIGAAYHSEHSVDFSNLHLGLLNRIAILEREEQEKGNVSLSFAAQLDETHLPSLLTDTLQHLDRSDQRTDLPKLMLQMNGLFDFTHRTFTEKIKEGGAYKKEFDPKNFINALFDEILYGTTKDAARRAATTLLPHTKLNIQEVRDDKKTFHDWQRSVLVSGITLSLTMVYDIEKINLLISFINDREPFVWKKALVGLYLILVKYEPQVKKDADLKRKLNNLKTQPDVQEAFVALHEALDNLDKEHKLLLKFSSGTKLHEYMDFFELPQHWFIPFYEKNAILEECAIEEPLKSLLTQSSSWCIDAFKYAFCKNFDHYEIGQITRLAEIYENAQKELKEIHAKELGTQYSEDNYIVAARKRAEIEQYLYELHYFFYAYPSDFFQNLFEKRMTFLETTINEIVTNPVTKTQIEVQGLFYIANSYDDKGNYEQAITCYEKAIALKPDMHDAFNNMGIAYRKQNDYEQAIACYEKAIAIKPDKHEAFNNIGIAYHNKNDYEQAIACYEKAIAIKPDMHEAFYNMGLAYANKNDYEQAIACYEKAIAIKPDKHEAFYNMGIAYRNKNDYEQAIACYEKVIAIKPDKHDAFNSMGSAYYNQNNYDQAISCYEKAIAIKPDKHEAFYSMGLAYDNKNNYDQAISCYEKVIAIKPDMHDAFYNMGVVYDDKNDYDQAISCYKKAIAIKPDYAAPLMGLGFLYLKVGHLALAEDALRQSIALGEIAFGNMNLGHVYLAQQAEEKAVACYRLSLGVWENKDVFWQGMEGDFQYFEQYNVSRAQYNAVLQRVRFSKEE